MLGIRRMKTKNFLYIMNDKIRFKFQEIIRLSVYQMEIFEGARLADGELFQSGHARSGERVENMGCESSLRACTIQLTSMKQGCQILKFGRKAFPIATMKFFLYCLFLHIAVAKISEFKTPRSYRIIHEGPDFKKHLSDHLSTQAEMSVLALIATKQLQLCSDEHRQEFSKCTYLTETAVDYSQCMLPILSCGEPEAPEPTTQPVVTTSPPKPSDGTRWVSGLRVVQRNRRQTLSEAQTMQMNEESQKRLSTVLSDYMLNKRLLREPFLIGNRLRQKFSKTPIGSSVQQSDDPERREKILAIAKQLLENSPNEPTDDDEEFGWKFLHKAISDAESAINSAYEKGTPKQFPKWYFEMINISKEIVAKAVHENETSEAFRFLSPDFFSIMPRQKDMRSFLSPDILSLNDDGDSSKLLSLPRILRRLPKHDQEMLMSVILELTGAGEILLQGKAIATKPKMASFLETVENLSESVPSYLSKVTNNTKNYNLADERFKSLERSMSLEQKDAMMKKGYAFMDDKQLELFYSKENPFNVSRLPFDKRKYLNMTNEQREQALLDYVRMIGSTKRTKRAVTLTALTLKNLDLSPSLVSQAIVLSPILLSTVVLSPAVLGPLILSPIVLAPLVLSPRVLSPFILSPSVLFPVILSPLVLHPFILSPLVLDPIVLSPAVLSPLVLSPSVLSPLILSPLVLSPFILSPGVAEALVLSPRVLTPLVKSKVAKFAIVCSPSVLSRRKRAAQMKQRRRQLAIYQNVNNGENTNLLRPISRAKEKNNCSIIIITALGSDTMPTSSTVVETVSINFEDFSESFLTCATCLCSFDSNRRKPKLLSCAHTVCTICLDAIAELPQSLESGSFRCPICRETIPLPRGGVPALPPSFLVNQLIDLMNNRRRDLIPKCSTHVSEELLFCETCDRVFCPCCNVETNECQNHTVVPFSIAIKRMSEIMLYKANQCVKTLHRAGENVKKELKLLEESGERVARDIDSSFLELNLAIERRRLELLAKVRTIQQAKHQVLKDQLSIIESEKIKIERQCVEFQSELNVRNITRRIGALNEKLDSSLSLVEPRENSFIRYDSEDACLERRSTVERLIGSYGAITVSKTFPLLCQAQVGVVQVVNLRCSVRLTTVDYEGRNRVTGGDPVQAWLTCLEPRTDNTVGIQSSSRHCPVEVVDRDDGTYELIYTPTVAGRYSLAVTIFGRPIKNSPLCLEVALHNNPLWQYDGRDELEPSSALFQPVRVGCGPDGRLFVLDTGHNRIKTIAGDGQCKDQFGGPALDGHSAVGLHVGSDRLLTLNWRSKLVTEWTLDGQAVKSFTFSEFVEPVDLAVDSRRRVVVLDTGAMKVFVFDHDDKPLFSFPLEAASSACATSVTTSADDHILIGGTDVRVYDDDGRFLRSLVPVIGHDTAGYVVAGLAVDRQGLVLATVCGRRSAYVAVFDQQGTLINKIDSHDSRLRRPSGICVKQATAGHGGSFCSSCSACLSSFSTCCCCCCFVADLGNNCVKMYRYK
ncbi:Tripartite motif-containing protein 2 [Trichinella sp. T9]|nr:Tripartite motif-containing protein 2 [Trichinella sp. T9]